MSAHATLARRMRQALEASNLTFKQVASRAGYTVGFINNVACRGAPRCNPTLGTLEALAGALGVDLLWLLGSDAHTGPQAPSGPRRLRTTCFSDEHWDALANWREAGVSWERSANALRDQFGILVQPDTLRRAWEVREERKKFST